MEKRKGLDFDGWLMLVVGLLLVVVGGLGGLLAVASGDPLGSLFLGTMSFMGVVVGGFIAVDVLRDPIWRKET